MQPANVALPVLPPNRLNPVMRLAFASVLFLIFTFTANAADPEKIDVFRAGEDGYKLYRIPGIVVTAKGTVLAYCEARKESGADWGAIDLTLRRSTDGGRTWSPRIAFPTPDGPKSKNPAARVKRPDDPNAL